MRNDSIETLLLRHYGHTTPVPGGLEEHLRASVRQEDRKIRQQEQVVANIGRQRVSRRRAVRLVAIGTTGLGLLSVGLEGLQMLEAALVGQDVTQVVHP